ncbi:MAG TPA: MMPL family transporter [Acidimicrobiales bacterium]|nr:MMPL family transporter [Acidimicrobiales bacterium]
MLARATRTMVRRRRLVVAAWVLALVVVSVLAAVAGGEHRTDYAVPGSGSARAHELLAERFPERAGDTIPLVFEADGGVDDPKVAATIADVHRQVAAADHVLGVTTSATSADGTVQLATVQLDRTGEQIPADAVRAIMDIAETADTATVTIETGGHIVQTVEGAEAGSEQIGMLAALVILLVAFGSILAAGLPIVVALLGIGVALGGVSLLTRVLMVPDWAPQIATMIAIGVGIDYALFIVTRYRTALADGEDPEDAVVTAMTTAGRAVIFAGGTVVISLLGLCVMGLEYLYGTAAATVTSVLVVLLAALTLLPAVLGFLGTAIDRFRVPFVGRGTDDSGLWARWSRVVQRRPGVTGLAALALLVTVAAPYGGLRLGYPDPGTGPDHLTSRRAHDLVAEHFGAGANGPLLLAVDLRGSDGRLLDAVAAAVAADEGVAAVLPAVTNAAGDAAVVPVVPSSGPMDEATVELVHRLRHDVLPAVAAGATVEVGGQAAVVVDESDHLGGRLPAFIAAVIALSFLLLLAVFRSVLVALKAAVMNLLAIGAAYGVMAYALQGGWFGELFGITESTPVPAWVPMMMFALLFGLSMDYEVFLLSRIREEYDRTGDNAEAVAQGMARTGRVISAAAAIMVTVFGAFVLGDQVLVKVIGLGMATAVLLDATVVRMVLVPSTMALLGDRNWWLPGWLDRVLPHLAIEAEVVAPTPPPTGEPERVLVTV